MTPSDRRNPALRLVVLFAYQLLLLAPAAAHAQWVAGGVQVSSNGSIPLLASDGAGGTYVVWERDTPPSNTADVFAQHVNAQGYVQWQLAGAPVTMAAESQYPSQAIPDGAGGLLVTFEDLRTLAVTGYDVYAMRLTAQGVAAPGWTTDGTLLSNAPHNQRSPVAASDGAGGFFFAWQDERAQVDVPQVYLQHLHGDGSIVAGWPAGGRCIVSAPSAWPAMAPDGAGGLFLAWTDQRNYATTRLDVYALHLDAAGNPVAPWPASGVPVTTNPYDDGVNPWDKGSRGLVLDGAGGFYVAWENAGPDPYAYDSGDMWCQHLQGDGTLAPGWPVNGYPVCVLPGPQHDLHVSGDGFGNLLLVWEDLRNDAYTQVYAQRMLASGSPAPGWPDTGRPLCTAPAFQLLPGVIGDGQGGAYVSYEIATGVYSTYVQHVLAGGAIDPGWPATGFWVNPVMEEQMDPVIVSDGAGGAIVAWDEASGVWAAHYGPGGVVPVAVSLTSVSAFPDRVELAWWSAQAASLHATVSRRTTTSTWQTIGAATLEPGDRLTYLDREVIPGSRYGYRLEYEAQGQPLTSAESWVEVPAAQLALEGARPNPASGRLQVWFSLAGSAPARLELLDVHGRRIEAHEVGALGAGRHMLPLGGEGALRSGIYWLRLTCGATSLRARAAVVR